MDNQRFQTISEALYQYGASDLNKDILKHISIDELICVSTSTENQRAAFRAAWALEHILLSSVDLLHRYQKQIATLYITTTNWSVLRSISKLLLELHKASKKGLDLPDEDNEEKLLEKTFQLLADTNCPIAVRCNAYDILLAFVVKHPWLAHELRIQIQFDLEKKNTPALSSRGLRILKKLKD
ncbi:hypothetical protein [Sphingobacterium paucimobilis]|uniref:Uncharacterized protein n=1 Tax=Sphingobacterium paucimobilis HER1398 TaxID=1346330 RepID=U2HDE9_9SPHI|nr:hypothetical protein [Sphingobacterium paucimobilis]ERJ59771.1 hypothetical protein M472_13420 [Sphingobacterium paucimobilis HER1398]